MKNHNSSNNTEFSSSEDLHINQGDINILDFTEVFDIASQAVLFSNWQRTA